MKGHEDLIDLRRKGFRPIGGVMVDATPGGDRWAQDWGRLGISMAFVDIALDDPLHRLDLRFAKGLPVDVSGEDVCRVGEVAKAFVKAGASRVIAGAGRFDGGLEGYRLERFAFGNDEVMQWPA